MLVNLDRAKQVYVAGQNLPSSALFLPETNTIPLERLLHRGKRNRPTNPADPYGVGSDSQAVPEEQDQDLDQDQEAGHVSRENPVSPNDADPWNTQAKPVLNSPRICGVMGWNDNLQAPLRWARHAQTNKPKTQTKWLRITPMTVIYQINPVISLPSHSFQRVACMRASSSDSPTYMLSFSVTAKLHLSHYSSRHSFSNDANNIYCISNVI